jgi:parvulin-like peptidyl-prolyl isomerase
LPKKAEKPQREMTKRQLSHWQKENRVRRILWIAGAVVLAAVLIVVGTGLYTNKFRPLNSVVITVGDKEYKMDYYIDALAYYGNIEYSTYSQYIDFQTYLSYITDTTAQRIEFNKLVIDSAAKLDPPVTISDEEVKQTIKDRSLTSNPAVIDVIRSELVQAELRDGYFNNLVPASAEQRAVLAMFLESQEQVDAVIARIGKGESFNDIAKEISRESISKSDSGDFGWVPRGVLPTIIDETSGKILEDKVFSINVNTLSSVEDQELSKYFGYWLLKVTETKQVTPTPTPTASPFTNTQVHLFGILVGSKEKALEIKAKLEAGGEGNDFETLAKANSEYTDASTNGGELGWKSKGDMGAELDKILFPENASQGLALNQVSDPVVETTVATKGGFWLTEITGIDPDKQITGSNRTALITVQQNSWGQKIWEENQDNLKNLLTDEQRTFAVEKAAAQQS